MSAWRVGLEAAEAEAAAGGGPGGPGGRGGGGGGGTNPFQAVVDRVTKWIPGDALALYVASVTALAAEDNARPSVALLIGFAVLAGALVLLSVFSSTGSIPSKSLLPAGLATGAFAIWSLTVPFSGWQRWDAISDHQAVVAIVGAVVALVYGLAAEGATKRWGT